jgi:Tol biopolymer transport system component
VVVGPFDKNEPQFSRDGRWLAYGSEETGEFEVYVMSFPDGKQRAKASVGGGVQPRWSPDGRELYYRAPGGLAVAVAIATSPRLTVGSPQRMFSLSFQGGYTNSPLRHQWAVAPDGQRFLARAPNTGRGSSAVPGAPLSFTPSGMSVAAAVPTGAPANLPNYGLTVVLDWPRAIRREQP